MATAWKEYVVPEVSPERPILKLPGPLIVCRDVDCPSDVSKNTSTVL
jgi:hypothetical protein